MGETTEPRQGMWAVVRVWEGQVEGEVPSTTLLLKQNGRCEPSMSPSVY